ncbi:MAG: ATP-dependent DNA helicase [Candidatus Woesearchaeota archaeon]
MTDSDAQDETEGFLFPYDKIRNVQLALMHEVRNVLQDKKDLIVHAPTGLGKTVAALAPALKYAIDNKKKIFFLTSRHTQHMIAINTLREIRQKYDLKFVAIDLIGKKWMCTVPGMDTMRGGDFYEYCKKQREDGLCEQFNATRKDNKLTPESKLALETLRKVSPAHIERFTELCRQDNLCSYEIAAELAKEATVIVADYYYIFHPMIRDLFLKKSNTDVSNCIVIVDEAHNLPDRIRDLMTARLSNFAIKRSINELKKIENKELIVKLAGIQDVLNELSQGMKTGEEISVETDDFVSKINKIDNYDDLSAEIGVNAQAVREQEKKSSLGWIQEFMETWRTEGTGFARILSQNNVRNEIVTTLAHRCLDPSKFTAEILSLCHSTILMSGTLTPTEMYRDILGFPPDTVERRYPSPFPESNKLTMIVPETTTKFSQRNPEQYKRIAKICAEITNLVPGNSAVFFPSYYLRDQVYPFLEGESQKTAFLEQSEMNKEEKAEFLERFKKYKDSGAVLLGVMSGSFGEGIDLPGDLLKCVVVVGLPLQQPNLETKELIKYYDDKFNKGWDYGYVGPAFSKCLQSAGRCIRSETDRGVVVFLDERYVWANYFKHFPRDLQIKTTRNYADEIKKFFG